jgi:hypothetical protein
LDKCATTPDDFGLGRESFEKYSPKSKSISSHARAIVAAMAYLAFAFAFLTSSSTSTPSAAPAAFLQRGSQLLGDPVAHNPNYVARRSGNDVGAILTRVS